MAPECAACGASVEKRTVKCPECSNQPRKDLAYALVAIGLAVALASILFPPMLLVTVLVWFLAAMTWGLARWLYPARKYSFDFSGIGISQSANVGEEQSR